MKTGKPHCHLNKNNKNIYVHLTIVIKCLQANGYKEKVNDMQHEVLASKGFEAQFAVFNQYVIVE